MKWRVKPNTRHFTFAKWRVLGFTHHFKCFTHNLTYFSWFCQFFWLCFSTMCILWDRQSQYDVLLIIHATKVILKSLVYDSWLQMSFVAFMTSKTSYWDCLLTGYLQYMSKVEKIFTEGDGMESRLSSQILSTLADLSCLFFCQS